MSAYIPVEINWICRRHMPDVLLIESEASADPWLEEAFVRRLQRRNCIGMVAESRDRILGFMIYQLHKGHLEILNLAIHPAYRRAKVGTQLVGKLLQKLTNTRRAAVRVDLPERNLAAQLFFKALGFKATTTIRGLFGEDDVFRLEYWLPGAERVELDDDGHFIEAEEIT